MKRTAIALAMLLTLTAFSCQTVEKSDIPQKPASENSTQSETEKKTEDVVITMPSGQFSEYDYMVNDFNSLNNGYKVKLVDVFHGESTPEEAAQMIQNRVSVLTAERY